MVSETLCLVDRWIFFFEKKPQLLGGGWGCSRLLIVVLGEGVRFGAGSGRGRVGGERKTREVVVVVGKISSACVEKERPGRCAATGTRASTAWIMLQLRSRAGEEV